MQVMSLPVRRISPSSSQDTHGPTSVLYLKSSLERPSLPAFESPQDDFSQAPGSLLLNHRSPKKLTICGLPSIAASPFTSSISTPEVAESLHPSSSSRVLFPSSTPTWIATPPTPPARSIRRSHTTSPRRSPFAVVPPSASFPASMHPHGGRSSNYNLKRCASVPTFPLRSREASSSSSSFMGPHIVQSTEHLTSGDSFDVTFSIHIGANGPILTRTEHSGSYLRSVLLLDNDPQASEKEDDGSIYGKSNVPSPEEVSPAGSWSDHSIDDIWETERNKDALRKFHALKELLATEVGYLTDLKALVTVAISYISYHLVF